MKDGSRMKLLLMWFTMDLFWQNSDSTVWFSPISSISRLRLMSKSFQEMRKTLVQGNYSYTTLFSKNPFNFLEKGGNGKFSNNKLLNRRGLNGRRWSLLNYGRCIFSDSSADSRWFGSRLFFFFLFFLLLSWFWLFFVFVFTFCNSYTLSLRLYLNSFEPR